MKRTHKDVEFAVGGKSFRTFEEAAGHAVTHAASTGRDVAVDILVFSRAGAKFVGGDYGIEQYDEDPDASVFERIVIKATSKGRLA